MGSTHIAMHPELHVERGAFARLENHRTDGWGRGSASRLDLDVWLVRKA